MITYPKIDTLFKRDKDFKITEEIRCPEFKNIKQWLLTEKIDGRNQRIIYSGENNSLEFRGRTNKAEMPATLYIILQEMFLIDKFNEIFKEAKDVCLFGESYGARIQKGGGNYNKGNSFRLFDVWINGCWLEWDSVEEIAKKLGIKTAPVIMFTDIETAIELVRNKTLSEVALDEGEFGTMSEGIVARSYPLMLFRNGNPIKFKLKVTDFKGGEQD